MGLYSTLNNDLKIELAKMLMKVILLIKHSLMWHSCLPSLRLQPRRIKVKEESPGPLSTETKLLGHWQSILALKSTLFRP